MPVSTAAASNQSAVGATQDLQHAYGDFDFQQSSLAAQWTSGVGLEGFSDWESNPDIQALWPGSDSTLFSANTKLDKNNDYLYGIDGDGQSALTGAAHFDIFSGTLNPLDCTSLEQGLLDSTAASFAESTSPQVPQSVVSPVNTYDISSPSVAGIEDTLSTDVWDSDQEDLLDEELAADLDPVHEQAAVQTEPLAMQDVQQVAVDVGSACRDVLQVVSPTNEKARLEEETAPLPAIPNFVPVSNEALVNSVADTVSLDRSSVADTVSLDRSTVADTVSLDRSTVAKKSMARGRGKAPADPKSSQPLALQAGANVPDTAVPGPADPAPRPLGKGRGRGLLRSTLVENRPGKVAGDISSVLTTNESSPYTDYSVPGDSVFAHNMQPSLAAEVSEISYSAPYQDSMVQGLLQPHGEKLAHDERTTDDGVMPTGGPQSNTHTSPLLTDHTKQASGRTDHALIATVSEKKKKKKASLAASKTTDQRGEPVSTLGYQSANVYTGTVGEWSPATGAEASWNTSAAKPTDSWNGTAVATPPPSAWVVTQNDDDAPQADAGVKGRTARNRKEKGPRKTAGASSSKTKKGHHRDDGEEDWPSIGKQRDSGSNKGSSAKQSSITSGTSKGNWKNGKPQSASKSGGLSQNIDIEKVGGGISP